MNLGIYFKLFFDTTKKTATMKKEYQYAAKFATTPPSIAIVAHTYLNAMNV